MHLRDSLLFLLGLIPSPDAMSRFLHRHPDTGDTLAQQLTASLMELVATKSSTTGHEYSLSTPENRRLAAILLREMIARSQSSVLLYPSPKSSESTDVNVLEKFLDSLLLNIGKVYVPATSPKDDTPGVSKALCIDAQ